MSRILRLEDPDARALASYDAVIDVRSPSEWAEDSVPGAINLPVMTDAERAEIGRMYVQASPFLARRRGAAITARNIAAAIDGALADKPADFRPLVYCWRGGQRSNAMALVLSEIGWRTSILVGGYRTYRRRVQTRLYGPPLDVRLVVIDGGTGTAKTEILGRIAALGGQVIDLEGLARHRGSLFGAIPGRPQPSQKGFESALLAAIEAADLTRPIFVECESSKIGDLLVPPALFSRMRDAPRVRLVAAPEARARYLLSAYPDLTRDRDALTQAIDRLPRHFGRDARAAWRALADAGAYEDLALALIREHYDPAYARSSRKAAGELAPAERLDLPALDPEQLDAAARRLLGQHDLSAG